MTALTIVVSYDDDEPPSKLLRNNRERQIRISGFKSRQISHLHPAAAAPPGRLLRLLTLLGWSGGLGRGLIGGWLHGGLSGGRLDGRGFIIVPRRRCVEGGLWSRGSVL
jgi:hypothetical protein